MRLRAVASAVGATAAFVALILTVWFPVPSSGQLLSSEEASPGFTGIAKQFELVDRAGRPWVGLGRNVRVRIDQDLAADLEMYLPNPLFASDERKYDLADPSWANRFTARSDFGRAVVDIVVAGPGPRDPTLSVPYELAFFYGDERLGGGLRRFTAGVHGITGLPTNPSVITVPDWVRPTGNEWLLMLGAFVCFMIAVTFGVYRPLYRWRLSKGGDVESARDLVVFVRWLFALGGYATMLYWRVPRSLPYMGPVLVLVVIVVVRLIALLKPRAANPQSA